jgi:hypothetical protein
VLAVPPETLGSNPGSGSMGRRKIALALSGLGRVWLVGISLSHRALVTPVAGLGAEHANQGRQVYSVSSDTLVRLASRLDARCVEEAVRLGWVVFRGDAWLSTLVSPAPVREL